ncbi:MAG: MFS transporter [Chloroflexi bacterium]|nr:MFS transporter [Chloroflexota bacterium]MDA1239809.1 MFS transporter [Chloroflexota bacterium]
MAAAPAPRPRIFYGWWIVVCGAVIAFSSGPGQTFGFSAFIDSIIEDTGLERTAISGLYAVGTGVSAVMVLLVSRLADRVGVRKTLPMVAIGVGLACISLSMAQGAFVVFIAFSALRALAQGSLTINGTLLTAQWFVQKRGRAMALQGMGFPVSLAVIPLLGRFLIDAIGWREAYVVLGVMVWVLVIPLALFVVRERPEDMGLFPDGADGPPAGETAESATLAAATPDKRRVLTSLRFWWLVLPLSTPALVTTGLIFHQSAVLEEQGMSATVAAASFVPMAVVSAVAALAAGVLVDRYRPQVVFAGSLAALVVAMLLALVMESPWMAVVYASLLGVCQGIGQVVNSVTWAYFYGRFGLGRVQGAAMMVMIAASALGPLPLAALQGMFDGFRPGIAIMTLIPVVAIIAILTARPPVVTPPVAA